MNLSKAKLFWHTVLQPVNAPLFPFKVRRNISVQSAIISCDAQPGHHRSDRRIGRSLRFDGFEGAQWERRRVGATRRRVQSLLLDRRYERRNSSRSGAPPLVDLVFAELESPWAMEIVRGAVAAASETGLTVSLTSLSEGADERSWLDHISARGTRGVILLLARLGQREQAELRARGLPFAVVDPRGEPDPSVTTVGATNWSGGFTATRHLIELGHRRVGVISGPTDLLCSRARMDGYRSAMEAAGLSLDPDLMQWGDFHVDGGFKEAMAMLALPNPRPPSSPAATSRLWECSRRPASSM